MMPGTIIEIGGACDTRKTNPISNPESDSSITIASLKKPTRGISKAMGFIDKKLLSASYRSSTPHPKLDRECHPCGVHKARTRGRHHRARTIETRGYRIECSRCRNHSHGNCSNIRRRSRWGSMKSADRVGYTTSSRGRTPRCPLFKAPIISDGSIRGMRKQDR